MTALQTGGNGPKSGSKSGSKAVRRCRRVDVGIKVTSSLTGLRAYVDGGGDRMPRDILVFLQGVLNAAKPCLRRQKSVPRKYT